MMQSMPATLERAEPKPATPRSVFILRFLSTIVLWSIALIIAFSGYELAFFALIYRDCRLDRALGILRHA